MLQFFNRSFRICTVLIICLVVYQDVLAIRKYSRQDLIKLREEVREMFDHAYTGYIKYAYPYDELRPLTCDGIDTWGSYSLTLIDALDTLVVMGNYTEFRRIVDIVTATANFDANINVSVFETNIRIVGGLLSAHLLSQRAGIAVEPGWPCNGPLLRLAEDVAQRLLPAFNTKTGMPLGTVNLRYGVPPGETPVTCTAGVGTFILEFATLSRLTGDPIYEEVAMNALRVLFKHRSPIGLFGNHIDVMTGRWVARDSGIGAGVDSYLEYLVKGSILLQKPELMAMFSKARQPIDKYLRKNHWYIWASMHKGQITLPVFQSLEAYWPGVLTLIGDVENALRSMHNYNSVWKQYGFTPEFYNIAQGEVGTNRESYPLRPELAESAMYLYRATGDPFMLDIGLNILRSIQHSAKTACGYATIKDTRDHTQENRMESFFLAETTKYLYLLFDPDNFIHNKGEYGRVHTLASGKQCILDSGGYIFNTEAHPIDAGALNCCHDWHHQDHNTRYLFKGESLKRKQRAKKDFPKKDGQIIPEDQQQLSDAKTLNLVDGDHLFTNQPNNQHIHEFLKKILVKQYKLVEKLKKVPTIGEDWVMVVVATALAAAHQPLNENVENLLNNIKTIHLKIVEGLKRISKKEGDNDDAGEGVAAFDELYMQQENIFNALNSSDEYRLVERLQKLSTIEESLYKEALRSNFSIGELFEDVTEPTASDNSSIKITKEHEPSFHLNEEENEMSTTETTNWLDSATNLTEEEETTAAAAAAVEDSGTVTSQAITLSDYIRQLIMSASSTTTSTSSQSHKFDPQHLLYNIRKSDHYRHHNNTAATTTANLYSQQYQLLTCQAQPFLIRITIAGEFLNEK